MPHQLHLIGFRIIKIRSYTLMGGTKPPEPLGYFQCLKLWSMDCSRGLVVLDSVADNVPLSLTTPARPRIEFLLFPAPMDW